MCVYFLVFYDIILNIFGLLSGQNKTFVDISLDSENTSEQFSDIL